MVEHSLPLKRHWVQSPGKKIFFPLGMIGLAFNASTQISVG